MVEGHVKDLIPAYALDCLDEEEIAQVAAHLAVCAECRGELEEYQALSEHLALATPLVEPPPTLKERLMERTAPPAKATQAAGRSPSRPFSGWFGRVPPAWGLASLALIVVLAASNLLLWRQVGALRQAAPREMRVVNLVGTDKAPTASGLVVISADGDHGTLVVDHLAALPATQQYQLWLIKDGVRTSGGVFSVDPVGYGSLWVASPQPLASYNAFGITIEPAGGSPGPTGERVLGGNQSS